MGKFPPSSSSFSSTTTTSLSSPPTKPPTRNEKIAQTFVQSWASSPTTTTTNNPTTTATFLSQFSPHVEWYDHAFFIQHRGHAGMATFRARWHRAIRDFRAEILSIDSLGPRQAVVPGAHAETNAEAETEAQAERGGKKEEEEEIIIRCIYEGVMVGNLPGRRASGRRFRTHVLIVLGVDGGGRDGKGEEKAGGKIERVDEYYTATLDEGCDALEYKLVGGGGGGGGTRQRKRREGKL